MKSAVHKLNFLYIIIFIISCFCVGQFVTFLLTTILFDLTTVQLIQILNSPENANKDLIISLSVFNSTFSFFVIPVIYLLVKDKVLLFNLGKNCNIRLIPAILSVGIIFSILPIINLLIEFNIGIKLPEVFSGLESYLKEMEEASKRMTKSLISSKEIKDLIIPVIVMAIIPGILEEVFFRGIIQVQLQNIFKNYHVAIWCAAFLFSFFHFQFYGFIPRMVLGGVFGYIFVWTKNIWYSCFAHITNNIIAILGILYLKENIFFFNKSILTTSLLIFLSLIFTGLIIFILKSKQKTSIYR